MTISLSAVVGLLALAAHAVLAAWASGHALLNKRDPRAAWAWATASWLLPGGGALLYFAFGVNRIQRRAQRRLGPFAEAAPAHAALPPFPGAAPEELAELARIGGAVTGLPLTAGNRIAILRNGDQAYPRMLAAIAAARESVWLCSYIFERGAVAEDFARALAAAQQRGVQVRVLLDGVGAPAGRRGGGALLRRHGVRLAHFLPARLLVLQLNLRNHRKLLVVDGRCAFIGGMYVADYHLARHAQATTDLHFEVEGPVVPQLASVFAHDWQFTTGEALGAGPEPPPTGPAWCRALSDGPNDTLGRLQLVLLAAIANAHRRVQIMTPYFIPTPELSGALQAAALRGVEVSLVLPERSDQPWMDRAARRWLLALVERGVRAWLQPPPFAHTKLFLVDDYYVQLGSANLDSRSLRLNFELNLEVFDAALSQPLRQHFAQALAASREVTAAQLQALPLRTRLLDALCWLWSPYL